MPRYLPDTPYNLPGQAKVAHSPLNAGRLHIDPIHGVPDFIVRDRQLRVPLERLSKDLRKEKMNQQLPDLSAKPDNLSIEQWLRTADQLAYYSYGYSAAYDCMQKVCEKLKQPYLALVQSLLSSRETCTWNQFLVTFGRTYYDVHDAGDSLSALMSCRMKDNQTVLSFSLFFKKILQRTKSVDPSASFLGRVFYDALPSYLLEQHDPLPENTGANV